MSETLEEIWLEFGLRPQTADRLQVFEKAQGMRSFDEAINFLLDRYQGMVEAGRKGGKAEKHFMPESKQRQLEGARKPRGVPKVYRSPESKQQCIDGARKGGRNSHRNRTVL